jgi:hypothetical protein
MGEPLALKIHCQRQRALLPAACPLEVTPAAVVQDINQIAGKNKGHGVHRARLNVSFNDS